MANEIRTGIKLEGDASGLKAAFAEGVNASKALSEQVDKTSNSSAKLGDVFKKVIDTVSGLNAGGSLPTAALSLSNISSIVDLLPGKFSLVAAGVIAIGSAFYQAHQETDRQAKALLLTGNYAGMVGGQLNDMARTTASSMGATVGNMRQIMEALVSSGQVTTVSLTAQAQAIELVTHYSGKSREAVLSDFSGMSNGVAAWAAKHNESYHFITYEQYKYIESLEKAGNKQEAMRLTSEALSQHLGGDLKRNMGLLESGWTSIGQAASWAWDKMLNVGREQTTQQRIAEAAAALQAAERRLQAARNAGMLAGGGGAQRAVDDARAQLEAAQEVARLERRSADAKSGSAQEEGAKIAADRDKKKDGGTSDFAANFINRLTTEYANLSGQMSKTEEVTRKLDTSSGKFTATQRTEALGLARAIDLRNNALQVSQNWTKYLQQQEQAQQAANDAFTANVIALDEQTRGYEFQISLLGKSTEEVQRLTAARNAQLALERMLLDLQRQLDTGAISENDALEREATLRNQANTALKEQLRLMDAVELRRRDMLAGAKDGLRDYETTAARVGDATANAVKSGFKSMEDAAVAFARTGKLEMTAMANSIISDLLRIQIQKSITGPAAGFLQGLFSGGGGSSPTQAAILAEQDSWFATKHTGGMVGGDGGSGRSVNPAVFRGAPRFHTGGITGDEVPIIAKRGEGVFTPGQMAALGKGMGGGNVALNVTVINNTDSQVNVRQKPGGSGMEFELLIDAVDAGLADRVHSGQSRAGQALAGRFGLAEAVRS